LQKTVLASTILNSPDPLSYHYNKPKLSTMAGLFDSRFKLAVHILQLILVHVVLIISGVRMLAFKKEVNFGSRGNTIALGMVSCPPAFDHGNHGLVLTQRTQGAKSLMIIFYQILTEHFTFFKKWHSFKANAILNSLEIVFWGAVCFLMIQANIQRCIGTSCILSWVSVGVSFVLV
jgi:hypothetical protein